MNRINPISHLITLILVFASLCTAASGKIIYVDDDATGTNDGSSWDNAYVCLQDALAAATGGDEIRIAQGVYKPDLGVGNILGDKRETFQLINNVTLKGGFAGVGELDADVRDFEVYETILSGDLNGDDVMLDNPEHLQNEPTRAENSFTVVTGSSIDETAVLDGLIITGGNTNSPLPNGGGMDNSKNSSPTLIYCTFRANSSRYGGGAMTNSMNSNPTLINCTFSGNLAVRGVGAMRNSESSPILTDCTFTGNWGRYGGGMYNDTGNPILTNCIFSINTGSGMLNDTGNPILTNCTFSSNTDSGIVNSSSSPSLTDCTFSGNTVSGMDNSNSNPSLTDCTFIENESCGMSNSNSNPNLTNCTFSGNSTVRAGGGMYNEFLSSPNLTNCTFIENESSGMSNSNSSPNLTNCTFSGNSAVGGGGIMNVDSSPILTNCIFIGNSASKFGGGMYNVRSNTILINCTFTQNSTENGYALHCHSSPGGQPDIELINCILWNGGNEIWYDEFSSIVITYSDVQGGYPGEGNIDVDPLFVNPGYWADVNDPNIVVEPNDPNAVWIDGDYHLKSETGRWNPASKSWVVDDVTSPCIDVGDPNTAVGDEPEPNGGRINMGAYGGTDQASMSPAIAEQIVYVQWLGHSTVKVWTEDCVVYVDPERVPEALHDATLVCVTHTHGDHYSPSDIAKVSNAQTQFIAPPDVVQRYGGGQTIAPGQAIEFDFVTIKAVPSYNTNKTNHPKSNNWVGYIIELAGRRVYVAGDTDLIEEMKTLGDIDVAFLPAGGTYTMNATEAAEATGYIKPGLAIPYHWGQSVGTLTDAQRFAELAQCPAMVLTVGESISSDNWPEYSPLVAHWAFDETEGDIAHNSVGENHIALFGEPAWQSEGGKINGALQFDGINDYGISDFVLDPANGPFSVFAWIKDGAAGQVIIDQFHGTGSGEMWLGEDPALGRLMTSLVPPPAGRFVPQPLISEFVITDGQWHHIGFVWDGSYRALYVDGTEVVKDIAPQNPLKSADGGLHIGAAKVVYSPLFSGLIDDVRIYNVALTPEQIEELAL